MAPVAFDDPAVPFDDDLTGFDGDIPIPPPSGDFPTFTLRMSESRPLDPPVWVDLTERLKGWTRFVGKGSELVDIDAGYGAITVGNEGGLFDPDNASSDLAGFLTARRRMQIVGTFDGVDYVQLDQFANFFPMDDDPTREAREVTIPTTDAFGLLANRAITPTRPFTLNDPDLGRLNMGNRLTGQPHYMPSLTGLRMRQILELIGWPEDLIDIDDGVTPVVEDYPTGKVLATLQQLARSEMGTLYAGAGGSTITFRERRRDPATRVIRATFADDDSGLPYEDISIDTGSPSIIKNRIVRSTADGSKTFSAIDVDSQALYGDLDDTQTDLLTARYGEIVGQCKYVLRRYKDGVPRVTGLTVAGIEQPNVMFPVLLGADLGWRFNVGRTPVLEQPPVNRVCVVESIETEASAPGTYRATFGLSEADTNRYFTLNDPVRGVLNAGNLLAY